MMSSNKMHHIWTKHTEHTCIPCKWIVLNVYIYINDNHIYELSCSKPLKYEGWNRRLTLARYRYQLNFVNDVLYKYVVHLWNPKPDGTCTIYYRRKICLPPTEYMTTKAWWSGDSEKININNVNPHNNTARPFSITISAWISGKL